MTNIKTILLALAAVLGITPVITAQIPVDNTKLPVSAKGFIKKHFTGVMVKDVERDWGKYEVELVDETELEFTKNGSFHKVSVDDGIVLSQNIIKEILPTKAIGILNQHGVLGKLESIEKSKKGYKVETSNAHPDEFQFDNKGNLLSIDD